MHWEKFAPLRTAVLSILGLAGLVTGAFLIYFPAGFITAGFGLFVLEWLSAPTTDTQVTRRA